jgi:imidazole glycerol-phosphate synthase subunit HisH
VTSLTIIDYDGGNLRSVQHACAAVGISSSYSRDPDVIRKASRLVFPGVGHAETALIALRQSGMDQALKEALDRGVWILGICLGSQLILDSSEEATSPALGFLRGATRRFTFENRAFKVPHIGWNEVRVVQPHFLLSGISAGDEVYFVHSYYPAPTNPSEVFAVSEHGGEFCCALGKDNLFATQFHPEKSGRLGLGILERFQRWEGQSC